MYRKKELLKAIEESEPDVMADYGEYYGSEWGISRGKLYEIIANLPTLTPPDEPLTCEGCIHEEKEHQNCNYCMRASYLGDYYYRCPPEGGDADHA